MGILFSSCSIKSCAEYSCVFVIWADLLPLVKLNYSKVACPFWLCSVTIVCIISEPVIREVADL